LDALRDVFESGPRDAEASQIEARVHTLLREAGVPASAVRSVACRERACRLELRWSAEHDAAYRVAMAALSGDNAKRLATEAHAPDEQDEQDAVDVVAYWLRTVELLPP
jgi:hypothetical protein